MMIYCLLLKKVTIEAIDFEQVTTFALFTIATTWPLVDNIAESRFN